MLLVRPLASFHTWLDDPTRQPYPMHYLLTMDAGPAWFLGVLLVFSLVYAATRAVRGFPAIGLNSGGTLSFGRAAVHLLVLMGVIAMTGSAWRLVVPDGSYWPIVGLPTPSFLPQYTFMFAAGVVAARYRWLERMPSSIAALGAALSLLALVLLAPGVMSPDPGIAAVAAGVVTAVLGVGLSVIVLVVIRQVAPGTGAIRRFLSANAFAVYVIHPAILVGLALPLQDFTAPAVVKFAALMLLAVPACWLLAAVLRMIPPIRRIL